MRQRFVFVTGTVEVGGQIVVASHVKPSPGDLGEYDLAGQRRLATFAQGSADCHDPLLQIMV